MELKVLAIVLAGGEGTRLYPLTKERAKPAVPFGGKYRIVDFVLSNLVNSGILSIYVVVQFRSQSLLQHLADGWQFGSLLKNDFIVPVPAQMRSEGKDWYRGTADAIHQNINLIEQSAPNVVAVFGADHIYRMNIREMIEFHEQKRAHITVAAISTDKKYSKEFGVIETTRGGRIIGFHEKKADAPTLPDDPSKVYASMGNYIFSTDMLLKLVEEDQEDPNSSHDFGRDILPKAVGRAEMFAYDFMNNKIPGEPADKIPYWRDVGTLDAYFEANMDIKAISPALNLFNRQWPLRTAGYSDPPTKFAFDEHERRGQAIELGARRRLHHLRRNRPGLGDRPARLRPCPGRTRQLHRLRLLRHRPQGQTAQLHSRKERAHSRRRGHRLRPGSRPESRILRHRHRHGRDRRQADAGGTDQDHALDHRSSGGHVVWKWRGGSAARAGCAPPATS